MSASKQKPSHYFATSHEHAIGTPRSKCLSLLECVTRAVIMMRDAVGKFTQRRSLRYSMPVDQTPPISCRCGSPDPPVPDSQICIDDALMNKVHQSAPLSNFKLERSPEDQRNSRSPSRSTLEVDAHQGTFSAPTLPPIRDKERASFERPPLESEQSPIAEIHCKGPGPATPATNPNPQDDRTRMDGGVNSAKDKVTTRCSGRVSKQRNATGITIDGSCISKEGCQAHIYIGVPHAGPASICTVLRVQHDSQLESSNPEASKQREPSDTQLDPFSTAPHSSDTSPRPNQLHKAPWARVDEVITEENPVSSPKRHKHPSGRTRSSTRFSDDTTMLKDFLHRAQARKAASLSNSSASPYSFRLPRRSPRRVLGRLDNNFPSPTKVQGTVDCPSATSSRSELDMTIGIDDGQNELSTGPPCRRKSSRKCLPAPTKSSPVAPSFIPVRRLDRGDPVKLQKSEAQELAIITRTNTRRNKGQSKFPKLTLETLGSNEAAESATPIGQRRTKSTKRVDWDKNLVRFHSEGHDLGERLDKQDKEEQGSRIRRVRRLGAVNGTPATKRMVGLPSSSNGTSAPRRRGRTRA